MNTMFWIGPTRDTSTSKPTSKSVRKNSTHWPRLLARRAAPAILALTCAFPIPAFADCFDDAAHYHGVNPWILRAIAALESGFKPATLAHNTDGSIDHGQTGINSVHLPELARYGVTRADLMDGCKSVFVAGWHLRNRINRYGNTWDAVGAYHSKTPSKRDIYKAKIKHIIDFWIAKGVMPG